ncbi:MAG: DUF2007 domain-containing protein [Mangrovibacterium sp.]
MSQVHKDELVLIYAGNPVNAVMINQLLNENGILTHIKNELMGTLAPWQVASGGYEPVEIFVLSKDEEHAKSVISAFNSSK